MPHPPAPSSIAELGHLVRVTWIYTTVMNQIMETNKKGRPPGPGDSVTADTIAYSEQCLHVRIPEYPEYPDLDTLLTIFSVLGSLVARTAQI